MPAHVDKTVLGGTASLSFDHIHKLEKIITPTFPFPAGAIFYQFSIRSGITFVELLHSSCQRI